MATSAAYIDLDEGAAPANPPTGKRRIYAKTDGVYERDGAGTEAGPVGSGGGAGLGAWTDYTPTWSSDSTPPTAGNATITGRYKQLDSKTYAIRITLTYGSTSSPGTGAWSFTLPPGLTTIAQRQTLSGVILDSGTRYYVASAYIAASDTKVLAVVHSESGVAGRAGAGAPMTWAAGDEITINGVIEVA